MKPTIYALLILSCLSIVIAYFVNGKVVSTPAPVAVLPESPWVLEGAKDKVGAEIYASCASCHMADGSGRSDGEVPRVAGQSEKVLVHKLQKLQDGSLYLPVMIPFARALTSEDLLHVSRYMAGLSTAAIITDDTIDDTNDDASDVATKPVSAGNNAAQLKYEKYCSGCHGSVGQGNDALLAPKLCGQHSRYLTRRMKEVKENLRGDADLAMASIVNAVEQDDQNEIALWLESVRCSAGKVSTGQVSAGQDSAGQAVTKQVGAGGEHDS